MEYILLIDKVTQTNRGQRAINEAIRDTLKSMQNQRSSMIDQTITALRHSNNNVVSGIAGVVRLGKFGHDISKVNDFAEDFCESFGNKISYIKSQLPTLTQILQKELNLGNNFSNSAKQPVSNVVGVLIDSASCSPIGEGCGASSNVVSVDAGALMNLLEQNNIITGTKVDSDYKNKLVSSKFAEYRKHVMPINRFLHKISVGSSSNDAAIGGLREDLAKIVSKSLMSEIRHHIANPIAHEGVHQSGLISKISDKIEIGISNLREALKSLENTEGSIIIDLNSDQYRSIKQGVAAGDSTQKINEQKTNVDDNDQEDQEKIAVSKPKIGKAGANSDDVEGNSQAFNFDEPGVESVYLLEDLLLLGNIRRLVNLGKVLVNKFQDKLVDYISPQAKDRLIKLVSDFSSDGSITSTDSTTIDISSNSITTTDSAYNTGSTTIDYQQIIDTTTGVTKPDSTLADYRNYLQEYENWSQLPDAVNKVPKEFGVPTFVREEDNIGLRYIVNNSQNIRIMKGKPDLPYPHKQVDYVAITDKGVRIDIWGNGLTYNNIKKVTEVRDIVGNVVHKIPNVKPHQIREAHINLEEWIKKWINWNKP